MSRIDIEKAMKKLPTLNDFGVGLFNRGKGLSLVQRNEEQQQNEELLLKSVEAFEKTCAWLTAIEKRKTINQNHSSYGLKHMAEKDIGYVTNGVFIAAAIHSGFDFKSTDGSPNVKFNMSEKSITQLWKRQEGKTIKFA